MNLNNTPLSEVNEALGHLARQPAGNMDSMDLANKNYRMQTGTIVTPEEVQEEIRQMYIQTLKLNN